MAERHRVVDPRGRPQEADAVTVAGGGRMVRGGRAPDLSTYGVRDSMA